MTAVHDYRTRRGRAPESSASVDKRREVSIRGIPDDLFKLVAIPILVGFFILGGMIIAWAPAEYALMTVALVLSCVTILFGGAFLFYAAYAKESRSSSAQRSGAIIVLIALMIYGIVGIIAGPFAPRVDSGGWDDFKRHVNYHR